MGPGRAPRPAGARALRANEWSARRWGTKQPQVAGNDHPLNLSRPFCNPPDPQFAIPALEGEVLARAVQLFVTDQLVVKDKKVIFRPGMSPA